MYVCTYLHHWSSYNVLLPTGSLVHTQCPKGKSAYCFIDLYQFPHDANPTANILLQVLKSHTPLPPTLYLQFDNCFRENKNRFIFGVCALLIELKVVKKVSYIIRILTKYVHQAKLYRNVLLFLYIQIKFNFLPVGHTHEDVDQMFSRISGHLRKQGAESIAGKHWSTYICI